MADTITDTGERVRAHVRKVLAELKALKGRQRAGPSPVKSLDSAVEVEREDNTPSGIADIQRPA
jgi:hypothetical protein